MASPTDGDEDQGDRANWYPPHRPSWSSSFVSASTPPREEGRKPTSDTIESLILDLLEWIGGDSLPYAEVLDAWRTSCPRLPVWEDANDRGYVVSRYEVGRGRLTSVTAAGRQFLGENRPSPVAR